MNVQNKNEINEIVSAIAAFLINDAGSDLETPYKDFLELDKLDYSLISLQYVDKYLSKVRKKKKLLSDEQFTKIILRCGAYCGEVIRKNSKIHFTWKTYDMVEANLEEFGGKSPLTYYILTRDDQTNFTFPMAKVEKFLAFGMQESLYSYALVIGEFR